MMRALTLCFAVVFGGVGPVFAGSYDDQYCTVISDADRHNSKGARLTTVAQVIQNERANFHNNRHRDDGDETDFTFQSKSARAQMAGMFRANSVGPFLSEQIVSGYGNVSVCVWASGVDFPALVIEVWRLGR
ncbi:hypothetical protein [Amylibacter sp. IMCC11727]|uniref:hypothetical protein n=1 Tax=Amylibacter sp. IMCC11727 TaxID=3039851 RepID=UPI00244E43A6|nr:hypothetical protein [Amylibacter sp. IMCC11727]WGI22741.1 hypothetical protein QBD29_04795 [Amylibacter sp. IMCC11727]